MFRNPFKKKKYEDPRYLHRLSDIGEPLHDGWVDHLIAFVAMVALILLLLGAGYSLVQLVITIAAV